MLNFPSRQRLASGRTTSRRSLTAELRQVRRAAALVPIGAFLGCLAGCVEVPLNDISMPPPTPNKDGGGELGSDGGVLPGAPGWHWESPRPQGNNLRALWGIAGATSAQDVLYAAGDGGTLLVGGSAGWQVQQGDAPSNRTILALAGQTGGNQPTILAVGMFDLALIRQSGQNFTDLNPLLGTGDGSLTGAWASPVAGEFFVAGTTGRMFWVRGNGKTWLREGQGVTTDSLIGIHGTGSGANLEVYAVGANGRIVHRAPGATSWAVEADALVAQQLNAVWCGDGALGGEVFAAGDSGTILHKKGGTWTTEPSPAVQSLLALWGYSSDVFAVGARGTVMSRESGTWKLEAVGLTDERLAALWGTTHDGMPVAYAAGNLGTLLRRERGNWELLSSRVTTSPLASVWARNASEYYAVGSDGVVLTRSGTGANGNWMRVANGITTNSLNFVHGYALNSSGLADVYAVGADGTILHQSSTGSGWAVEGVALTSAELTSIWVGADSVWVVGRGGRMGKKLGGVWTPENGPGGNPVAQDLYAVWGSGQGTSQVTYAAGGMGLIIRRSGGVWTQEGMGLTDQTITTLFGQSENDLYAFGNKGATLHRVGGTWRLEQLRQFQTGAYGVSGSAVPSSTEYYATGTQGIIMRFNNSVWSTESSLTLLPSSGIAAATSTDVVAVGTNGLILHKY